MADLTVLSSLAPMPPHPSISRPISSLYNARASSSKVNLIPAQQKVRPKLSQLDVSNRQKEKIKAEDHDSDDPDDEENSESTPKGSPISSTTSPPLPVVSPMPIVGKRPTHRPTRSQSAPPERIHFRREGDSLTPRSQTLSGTLYAASASVAQFSPSVESKLKKGFNSPSSTWVNASSSLAPCELLKPPPPLHRPTTFWRRTPRSGVTSSSYSPSTHLIRRSTFIAAGLPFDRPMYDASALGVESRIVHDAISGKVTEAFWEVIEAR